MIKKRKLVESLLIYIKYLELPQVNEGFMFTLFKAISMRPKNSEILTAAKHLLDILTKPDADKSIDESMMAILQQGQLGYMIQDYAVACRWNFPYGEPVQLENDSMQQHKSI